MKPSLTLLEFILSCSDFLPCMLGFAFTSPTESCFPHLSQLLPEPSKRAPEQPVISRLEFHLTHPFHLHNSQKCLKCSLKWGFRILPSASWFHVFYLDNISQVLFEFRCHYGHFHVSFSLIINIEDLHIHDFFPLYILLFGIANKLVSKPPDGSIF